MRSVLAGSLEEVFSIEKYKIKKGDFFTAISEGINILGNEDKFEEQKQEAKIIQEEE